MSEDGKYNSEVHAIISFSEVSVVSGILPKFLQQNSFSEKSLKTYIDLKKIDLCIKISNISKLLLLH